MKKTPLSLLVLLAPLTPLSALEALATDDVTLSTQTVQADFRKTDVQQIPEAVTLVGSEQIEARSAQHLEQILSFAPNVNFASGASRGRYYQIRGIGERSQFVDPVNPSVGLVIDGIDMTGLGAAATLFDVQQVEILRGPQGTRFGANALAGMINIRSNDPTQNSEGYISAKAGNYDSYGLGGAVSGSLTDDLQGRLAVHTYQSDGYMDNTYLKRDDTNNVDEVIARGKLAFELSDDTTLGMTYLYADIDNGYDAFSLDNTRTTYSDDPGVDTQDTNALALSLDSRISSALTLQSELTYSQSDVEYSYDEDWSYVGIAPGWEYSGFDQYLRDYNRSSADVRLLSGPEGRIFSGTTDWVAGIYAMQRGEDLIRNYTSDAQFTSELTSASVAGYGELSADLNTNLRLISGMRIENWKNDFKDNRGIKENTDETLVGGRITLEAMVSNDHLVYATLARGYKAGGVNSEPVLDDSLRVFKAEINNSIELGVKSSLLDNSLQTRVAAFYIDRKNQQIKNSFSYMDGGVPKFKDYIGNTNEGKNYGIEIESDWNITERLNWALSWGYLITEIGEYTYESKYYGIYVQDGRQQAHAPQYNVASALTYALTDVLSVRVESEAKDSFYFSDSHNLHSQAYVLWHARVAYVKPVYEISVYGRNLTGVNYETRGFGFANDPRDEYTAFGHVQYGDPMTYGIEAKYSF
ncbi:TonB-dependent receptor [Thalassolituus sp. C2-1]|uniref:TonB-dependent receptor n=1 Tax=Venatorbacter sp. C2-1 TaxID=2597518 RepID=UPI00118EAA2E|nr:TonB-dependent receptor plug domain-containing protein [Thalassolituus sp. C2-1]TVV44519.1 TonB-dependent receptor [Thalassolituus sp. C2-1]